MSTFFALWCNACRVGADLCDDDGHVVDSADPEAAGRFVVRHCSHIDAIEVIDEHDPRWYFRAPVDGRKWMGGPPED